MSTRRSPFVWWAAGVLFLIILAGWVFRASLKEQRKPRSSFGANPSLSGDYTDQNQFPPAPEPPPLSTKDPHIQETLRTINEINRINQLNADLRKNATPTTPSPLPALPARELPQKQNSGSPSPAAN